MKIHIPDRITPFVVGLIRRRDGKYLMTDRVELDPEDKGYVEGNDFWQFPGGGIEINESVEDALRRELKEETGVDIREAILFPQLITCLRPGWHGIMISFLCVPRDENPKVRLNHESSRFGWFTAKEIKSLNSFKETYPQVRIAESILQLGVEERT